MSAPLRHGEGVEQEPDRVDRRRLGQGAILTAAGIAVAVLATLFFLRDVPRPSTAPPAPPAADTSFVVATQAGITLRDEQRRALEGYGWVDRDAGVARIPIERAMDLLAADGGAP
ncbi:MAG: hypothetical protein JWP97_1678 [Labilithrix sp.]|nr:hypothetical protein [Labilithrix sp.]